MTPEQVAALRDTALAAYWAWQQNAPDTRDRMEDLYRAANGYPDGTPTLNPVTVAVNLADEWQAVVEHDHFGGSQSEREELRAALDAYDKKREAL